MKLYNAPVAPNSWIGEDEHGMLMVWPREANGWARRTTWLGGRRHLTEVEPALARGTRWPGAGRSRRPRAASGEASHERITLRATAGERAAWEQAAKACEAGLTVWARDVLNAEVAGKRGGR